MKPDRVSAARFMQSAAQSVRDINAAKPRLFFNDSLASAPVGSHFGEVITVEDLGADGQQYYTVELLGQYDKLPTGVEVAHCQVADDLASALSVGDRVMVMIETGSAKIVSGGSGGPSNGFAGKTFGLFGWLNEVQ